METLGYWLRKSYNRGQHEGVVSVLSTRSSLDPQGEDRRGAAEVFVVSSGFYSQCTCFQRPVFPKLSENHPGCPRMSSLVITPGYIYGKTSRAILVDNHPGSLHIQRFADLRNAASAWLDSRVYMAPTRLQ